MALEIYFFQKTIMKNKEKGRNTQVHRYLVRPRGRHVVIKQSVNNLRIERYQKAEHRSRPVMPHTPSRGAQQCCRHSLLGGMGAEGCSTAVHGRERAMANKWDLFVQRCTTMKELAPALLTCSTSTVLPAAPLLQQFVPQHYQPMLSQHRALAHTNRAVSGEFFK